MLKILMKDFQYFQQEFNRLKLSFYDLILNTPPPPPYWIHCIHLSMCLDDKSWTAQLFATKLGMMVHHH